jgi:hypothetical protein
LANSIAHTSPSAIRSRRALEGSSASRMRLLCNQLDEYFSFQNLELAVRPLPLLFKKKTNVGSMKLESSITNR